MASLNQDPNVAHPAVGLLSDKSQCSPALSIPSLKSDSTWSPTKYSSQAYSQDSSLSKEEEELEREEEMCEKKVFNRECYQVHKTLIEKKPKVYLGIESTFLFLISMLASFVPARSSIKRVYLTLFKVKLNNSFEVIGDYFGMSRSMASRIFSSTLPIISRHLSTFVYRPNQKRIRLNLPMVFRYKYFNVTEIIDCFEVQIEKPSNPLHQALTWSEYKKANTIKYLVACTPDGFITYISKGYGGKISDTALIRECKYFDTLEPGMVILADRGFKFVEKDLIEIQCHLVRPPSVGADQILTKEEGMVAKEVAALRVHVERCIGRIREYLFISPHATTDNKLIDLLDDAVITACALTNTQSKLLKV